MRRPPFAGLTPSAHDVAREHRVCVGLHPTEVPVPRPVLLDESGDAFGAPFTVVEHVAGATVRTQSQLHELVDGRADAIDDVVDALVRTLLTLHRVDVRAAGLERHGRSSGYAERQLARWSGQWQVMGADDPRAGRLLDALRRRLPDDSRVSVVHGDYRIDNTILAPDLSAVRAVIDWELSTLGDPVADVALMCAYRNPALDAVLGVEAAWTSPRLPDPEELRGRYEEMAGAALPDWEFHLGLAYYKLAVIAEGIAYRHRLGATAGEGFEAVGSAVGAFLDAGLEQGPAVTSEARHG